MDTSQDLGSHGGGENDDASSYSYMSEHEEGATPQISAAQSLAPSQFPAGGGGGGGSSSSGGGGGAAFTASDLVKPNFLCLTAAQLQPGMARVVRDVAAITHLPPGDAELALHHYGWRVERLMEAWASDCQGARAALGLSAGPDPAPLPSPLPAATAFCPVSLEECPWGELDGLPCGHRFAKAAWAEGLAAAMQDPMRAQLSCCLAFPACRELVRARMFQAYLPPPLAARHREFAVRRYTEASRHIVWCPGQGCQYAIVHTEQTRCVLCAREGGRARGARRGAAPPIFTLSPPLTPLPLAPPPHPPALSSLCAAWQRTSPARRATSSALAALARCTAPPRARTWRRGASATLPTALTRCGWR